MKPLTLVLVALLLLAIAFGLGAYFFSGGAKIAYWKGRTEEVEATLQDAVKEATDMREEDKRLQEEKDEEIFDLRATATRGRVRVIEISTEIAETTIPAAAAPIVELYEEKVAELEGIIKAKNKELKAWKEKFDSKVELAVKAGAIELVAQRDLIDTLRKRCSSAESQVRKIKFGGKIFKIAAYVGAGYFAYSILRRK